MAQGRRSGLSSALAPKRPLVPSNLSSADALIRTFNSCLASPLGGPEVAHDSIASGIARFVQELFCQDEIARAEPLSETVVHRTQRFDRFGGAAPIA
jgi:hypothetical protein